MSTTSGALSHHTKNNLDLSTNGMIYTLIINIVMFLFLLCFFEANRFYRQIFLKRFQKRFIDIGRVPPIPPQHVFGWLVAVFRVPELEVLHMVGLDGYMLLRYHTVCLKFSLFASATGEFWYLRKPDFLNIDVSSSCTSHVQSARSAHEIIDKI